MTADSPADLRIAAKAHLRAGRFAAAATAYRALVEGEPNAPDLRYGLGAALSAAGDEAGADDAWSTARVFHGLALLRELGIDMERFAADPNFAADTGRELAANGLPGVAAVALARAIEALGPQMQLLADYAVCLLHQGAQQEACEILSLASEADAPSLNPLLLAAHAFADDGGVHRSLLARQIAGEMEATAPAPLSVSAPAAGRVLNIGYLPGSAPLDPRYLAVIAHHDPATAAPLLLVESLDAAPDGFPVQSIGGLSDQDAAGLIAALGIDVLVDLSGPSGGRLGVFACRAAPVQVAWNSDLATTGLSAMDAKLLPSGVIERDAALLFCENLVCMGPVLAPWWPVEIAPRQTGGRFTLGVFMPPALLTPAIIAAIARIGAAQPQARIMLKHPVMDDPVIQRVLAAKFLSHGLARERLDFRGMAGDELDVMDFEAVDLAIDSRPSMGESQILTLLGHGVPVLVAGEPTTRGALAVAPLLALGLRDLAADNLNHLVARAIELAADRAQLAAIRARIEDAFTHSAYGDVRRVAGDLQAAFDGLVAEKMDSSLQAGAVA